jgi:hypothetical protein
MAASFSQTETGQHLILGLHVAHYVPIKSSLALPEQQIHRSHYLLDFLFVLPGVVTQILKMQRHVRVTVVTRFKIHRHLSLKLQKLFQTRHCVQIRQTKMW